MASKIHLSSFLWLSAGALISLALILLVLHFREQQNPAAEIALKARKVELVTRMRLALASASEAEKSAVMATSDRDSKTFADQARSGVMAVQTGRQELEDLLHVGSTKNETELLADFTGAFAKFERIEEELLQLAVKSTNLKAYSLAYGPAAEALNEMDAALSRIVVEDAKPTRPDAMQVVQLASNARIGALRIQALLPPHIAEESDQKMDELEAQMAREDLQIRTALESLTALLKSSGSTDIETAAACYAKFTDIRAQIIKLSRENTNVRSLMISLNEQRKVMLICQDGLAALEQAIQEEPIAGVTFGRPVHPR
jgi:hypothetical protein